MDSAANDDLVLGRVAEIIRLLDEAYDHYFAYSDGYCKSSEGHVSISFGNFFERRDDKTEGKPALRVDGVEVYSYVLGPSRSHYFGSLPEALAAVQKWHACEMATDHAANDAAWEAMLADE